MVRTDRNGTVPAVVEVTRQMPDALRGRKSPAAEVRPPTGQVRDDAPVIDESKIATHLEPAARERSNHIVRLDLSADGLPGHYEQVWTRTDGTGRHELCCIPFFTYGLSLGDVITITSADGAYQVESKAGHRTIRIAIQDQKYAHERHQDLHGDLAEIGVLTEFRGHANSYGAVDIVSERQADAVIAMLGPLTQAGTVLWEWADPAVAE